MEVRIDLRASAAQPFSDLESWCSCRHQTQAPKNRSFFLHWLQEAVPVVGSRSVRVGGPSNRAPCSSTVASLPPRPLGGYLLPFC